MSVLTSIQSSALSQWLSVSMLGVPTMMGLHSVGMAVAVGLSLMVTLRLYGVITGFRPQSIRGFPGIAVPGFALNLLTGVVTVFTRAADYAGSPLIIFKLVIVGVSAVLLFLLRRRFTSATAHCNKPGVAQLRVCGIAVAVSVFWSHRMRSNDYFLCQLTGVFSCTNFRSRALM
jgi:hypothetical protein